jgi:hypothetical protein
MDLAIKQGQVFKIAEIAYREGVVDKALPLTGEAMTIAKQKTGFALTEMMEAMNEAEDRSVELLDKLLGFSGPLLALAGREFLLVPLMGLASRLLDFAVVQRLAVWTMAGAMQLVFKSQLKSNARKLAALGVK